MTEQPSNNHDLPDVFAELQAIAKEDRPRMSEGDFVANVLPLLTTSRYDTRGEDLTPWLNIAGTPHGEVDIVNEAGEVIFTVPPILARTATMVDTSGTNLSVAAIASNYAAMLGTTHPAQADSWFLREIANVVVDPAEEQLIEYLRMWLFIRVRYGLPVTDLIGDVKPTPPEGDPTPEPAQQEEANTSPAASKFDDFDL